MPKYKPEGKTATMGFFAFVALIFNALAWLIGTVLGWFESTARIGSMLSYLASLILTVLVVYVAHGYAKRLTKTWRIIYWVIAIVSILSILVGFGYNFAK